MKFDKISSVFLVVCIIVFFECGEMIVVESVGSFVIDDDDVVFVEFGAYRIGDVFGVRVDGGLYYFVFWGELEIVVDEFSVLWYYLIFVVYFIVIEVDGFECVVDGE